MREFLFEQKSGNKFLHHTQSRESWETRESYLCLTVLITYVVLRAPVFEYLAPATAMVH